MLTAKGSNTSKRVGRQRKELWVEDGGGELYRRATIDVLYEDVLLKIFDFYVEEEYKRYPYRVDGWSSLVHVCRRWRYVVFASPHRLNLRLLCTRKTPVKKLLGVWPKLPIVIYVDFSPWPWRRKADANIDAALKHNDRICQITIKNIQSSLLKRMDKPFTALTYLDLWSNDETVPIVPDSFSGGSAPRLRTLAMEGIPFLGLPKLLLSAHHLVDLHLSKIPHSGYISPEAMVTALSSLTSLRSLVLKFRSPRSRPAEQVNRQPSALMRTVLPALTCLIFKGISEYFEVLISRFDVPLLDNFEIAFFNQLVFHVPLLHEFIRRTEAFKAIHRTCISILDDCVKVTSPSTNPEGASYKPPLLGISISCRPLDWQLSSLEQVCNSFSPRLPTLERLDIRWYRHSKLQDDIENTQWLEVLQPFFTVKDLYLDKNVAPHIAPTLQALAGERVTEALPALQNIFVPSLKSSGPVHEAIAQFVAARQLVGHPTAVCNWE